MGKNTAELVAVMDVGVRVGVAVALGKLVRVGVGVLDTACVGEGVKAGVGVADGREVAVGVRVWVGVRVAVGAARVAVAVLVTTGTASWAA
jgi:hypothetical protein